MRNRTFRLSCATSKTCTRYITKERATWRQNDPIEVSQVDSSPCDTHKAVLNMATGSGSRASTMNYRENYARLLATNNVFAASATRASTVLAYLIHKPAFMA